MKPLARVVDPGRLADEGGRLQGTLELATLARLAQVCEPGATGDVAFDLEFLRDRYGLRRMRGTIDLRAPIPCSRCLQPVWFHWHAAPDTVWIRKGEAEPEAGAGDVAEWSAPVSLNDLIEEELLLALPMLIVHEDPPCAAVDGSVG